MSKVDLHLHTTASDGSFSPEELVRAADKQGLEVIAVTDHDTVAGISPALEAAQEVELEVVPGIELTTYRGEQRIDVLGYYLDYRDDKLKAVIDKLQNHRRVRARQILDKLAELGIELEFSKLEELAGEQGIGRPHIAKLMVNEGYVPELQAAFDRYLEDGGPAYVPKYRLSPTAAVDIIRQVGGLPVLAHPGEIEEQQLAEDLLAEVEFAGIEAYYSGHTQAETEKYLSWAKASDRLVTGGSDCHGPAVESKFLLGTVDVPKQIAGDLSKLASN